MTPRASETSVIEARSSSSQSWRQVVSWSAGASVALSSAYVLLTTGAKPDEILRFAAYWLVGVLIPGVAVHRVLRRQAPTMVEDLGLGAATGIALELLAGVVLGLLGIDSAARWWSGIVYAALILVPRFRAAVRTRPWQRRESPLQAWAIAAVGALVLLSLLPFYRSAPLPPQDSAINIDPWWHLSLTAEMLKPGPPQIPQVAGEPLVYHWFSHLHMAIAGDAADVDLPTVVFRLWIVPVALSTVAVIVALARQLSRTSWAGPLAAWLTLLAVAGGFLWPAGTVPARVVFFLSPSQTLTNLLVVAAAVGLVDVLSRTPHRKSSVWLLLLVFACTGAKPTALTALLGGTVLASVASTLVHRRLDRKLLAWSIGILLLLVFVMPLMSGSLSGKMTVLAPLESLSPYSEIVGEGGLLATSSGILLDSLDDPLAWFVATLTLGRVLVGHAPTFLGTVGLVHPTLRREPGAWWLAGAFLSGWAAFLVVDHPSRSQFYFLSTTFVFGAALSAWFVAVLTPTGRLGRRTALLGLIVGSGVAWLARAVGSLTGRLQHLGLLDGIWIPIAVAAVGLLALTSTLMWLRRRGSPLVVAAVLSFATIGMAVPGAIERLTHLASGIVNSPSMNPDTTSIDFLTRGEQEAAMWLAANSDPADLIATNAHCRPGVPYVVGCDARGFWLSALSERRVLLEGWGYTPQASAAWGVGGLPSALQPSPWPARLKLSQEVFAAPTRETVEAMRARGVTWLVGVRRSGPVSNELGGLANVEFDNGDVAVYRIESVEGPEVRR